MKKKILYGLLAIMLCATLTGCGDKEKETEKPNNNETQQNETQVSNEWL